MAETYVVFRPTSTWWVLLVMWAPSDVNEKFALRVLAIVSNSCVCRNKLMTSLWLKLSRLPVSVFSIEKGWISSPCLDNSFCKLCIVHNEGENLLSLYFNFWTRYRHSTPLKFKEPNEKSIWRSMILAVHMLFLNLLNNATFVLLFKNSGDNIAAAIFVLMCLGINTVLF